MIDIINIPAPEHLQDIYNTIDLFIEENPQLPDNTVIKCGKIITSIGGYKDSRKQTFVTTNRCKAQQILELLSTKESSAGRTVLLVDAPHPPIPIGSVKNDGGSVTVNMEDRTKISQSIIEELATKPIETNFLISEVPRHTEYKSGKENRRERRKKNRNNK